MKRIKFKEMSKKEIVKWVLKGLIKNVILLIIGVVYATYLLIHNFNILVANLFMGLPRLVRVFLIYILCGTSIVCSLALTQKTPIQIIYKEKEKNEVLEKQPKEEVKDMSQNIEEEKKCELSEIECMIYNKAIEKGLSEKEAFTIMAISKHETGSWTSKAFKEKNNFGGIMSSTTGELKKYNSQEEGLEGMINLLKNNYFGKGLTSIKQIGEIYCPVGATNDPKGLNKYWIPNVTQFYNEYALK
jgi:hypothetical protein